MQGKAIGIVESMNQWIQVLDGHLPVGRFELQTLDRSYRTSAFLVSGKGPILVIGLHSEGRSETAHKIVVSHEFGHLVFFENLVFEFRGKKWTLAEAFAEAARSQERLSFNLEYQRLISEIRELGEVLKLAKMAGKTDQIRDLSEAMARRQEKAMEIDDRHSFADYANDVLLVYNELFADAFALLMNSKNPRAITESIDIEHDSHLNFLSQQLMNRANNDGKNVPAPREFAVTGFKNWKHELGDAYTLLDPARGVLWELYMKNIKPEHIPLFLKTFIDATGRHVSDRMASSTANLRVSAREADPLELNQSFLRYFRAAANRNGLPIAK